MRQIVCCLSLFAMSCEKNNHPPLPASSRPWVEIDPLKDVTQLPNGNFSITPAAIRQLKINLIEDRLRRDEHVLMLEGELALTQLRSSRFEKLSNNNTWLSRWGMPIGALGGSAFTVAVVLVALMISK